MDRETIKAFHQATAYIRKLEFDTGMPEFGKYGDAMDAFFVAVDDQQDIVQCKCCNHWDKKVGWCNENNHFSSACWFCADGEK